MLNISSLKVFTPPEFAAVRKSLPIAPYLTAFTKLLLVLKCYSRYVWVKCIKESFSSVPLRICDPLSRIESFRVGAEAGSFSSWSSSARDLTFVFLLLEWRSADGVAEMHQWANFIYRLWLSPLRSSGDACLQHSEPVLKRHLYYFEKYLEASPSQQKRMSFYSGVRRFSAHRLFAFSLPLAKKL